jgi:DNA uptake protein ComE-like DNA-binding protein
MSILKRLKSHIPDLPNSIFYGFLILISIIFFIFIVPNAIRKYSYTEPTVSPDDQKILDSLITFLQKGTTISNKIDSERKNKPETKHFNEDEIILKNFNPNTATLEDLALLGLSKKTSMSIVNYRQKGGVFKIKSDLKKIYALKEQDFYRLYPYIDLPETLTILSVNEKKFYPKRIDESIKKININLCDSLQLVNIKGIGPYTASKVIRYREKLGGFISLDQIDEIKNLDSSTANILKKNIDTDKLYIHNKIKLDSLGLKLLFKHPYCGYHNAKIISNYLKRNGNIYSMEQLKSLHGLDTSQFSKLKLYLEF